MPETMRRTQRLSALLLLAALLPSCWTRRHASDFESEIVLPVAREHHWTVKGRLANGVRGRFIFDTGSDETLVMKRFVEEHDLELEPVRGAFVIRLWGGAQERVRNFVHLRGLSFHGVRIEDHLAPVIDQPLFVAGVLGMDVMGDWVMLFDARQRQVRLLERGSVRRRLAALYPGLAWEHLPLVLNGSRPYVEVDLPDGRREPFLIDTGSSRTTLPPRLISELGLRRASGWTAAAFEAALRAHLAMREITLDGGGAPDHPTFEGVWPAPIESYRLPYLGIGSLAFSVPVEVLDREGGLLGWDVLAHFPFVVDARARRFWIPRRP